MSRERIVGPAVMDCPERCEVPDGAVIVQTPPSRHAWSDVAVCPNDGCGRQFLVLMGPKTEAEE